MDYGSIDVKAANLLIDLRAGTDEIDKHLQDHPAEAYPPRTAPELWSGPIITVKSQPLPNMGLNPSLDNIKISLGDYGGCTSSYLFSPYSATRASHSEFSSPCSGSRGSSQSRHTGLYARPPAGSRTATGTSMVDPSGHLGSWLHGASHTS